MRWPLLLLALGLPAAVVGCRSSGRQDLVEAELRAKDEDLRVVRSELERTEAYNQFLQRELHNVQHAGPVPADGAPLPDCRVKTISLGRQTSGYENDGVPGDEALQVVLEPRDADNHTIKAGGSVQVQALEVMPSGIKKPLSMWQITPDELRKTWKSGLLSTGYFIVLPWKSWPTTTKVRVVVQFLSEDRRLFEADKDVTVRVAPALYRKTAPAEDPPPLMPPADKEVLPVPRPVEPEKKEEGPSISEKKPIATSAEEPEPLRGAVELLKPVSLPD